MMWTLLLPLAVATEVLVATEPLPIGRTIEAGDVVAVEQQPDFVPDGALPAGERDRVVGATLLRSIEAGQVFRELHLDGAGAPAAVVPLGMRWMDVPISLPADDVRRGEYADLWLIRSKPCIWMQMVFVGDVRPAPDGAVLTGLVTRQGSVALVRAGRMRATWRDPDDTCNDLLCEETATCVEGRCVPACVAPEDAMTGGRTAPGICSRARKPLSVAATSAPLIDFPLLVSFASDPDLAAEARDDGRDIGFTEADGSVLDHELARFVKATGELRAWVLVPRLSDGGSTTLYLHYGGEVVPENSSRVWQGYRGVWHLDEIDTVTPDSSPANSNGQVAAGVESAEGQVAGALQTNSIGEALNLGDPADGHLDFDSEGSFTVSVWVQFAELSDESQLIAFKGAARDGDPGYQVSAGSSTTRFQYRVEDPQELGARLLVDGIAANVWYSLSMVLDRDRSELRAYRDGELLETGPVGNAVDPASDRDLIVGSQAEPLRGLIDELRIRASVPNDAWIAAEHNNQRDPASFVAVGPVERL